MHQQPERVRSGVHQQPYLPLAPVAGLLIHIRPVYLTGWGGSHAVHNQALVFTRVHLERKTLNALCITIQLLSGLKLIIIARIEAY